MKEYTHLGKTVVLLPGKRFSKKELIIRLQQMNVQFEPNSKIKKYYEDLYENAIKYDVNKIKIFDKLFKDTVYHSNKIKGSKIDTNQSNISPPVQNNNNTKMALIQNKVIKQEEINNNNLNKNNRPIAFDKNKSFHSTLYTESNSLNNSNYNRGNNQNNQSNINNYNYNNIQENNNQLTFKDAIINEIRKSENQYNQRQNQIQNNRSFYQGQNQMNYDHNQNMRNNPKNNIRNSNQYNAPNQNQYHSYNQQNTNYNYTQNQQNYNNIGQNNYMNQSQINESYQNYNNQNNNRYPSYDNNNNNDNYYNDYNYQQQNNDYNRFNNEQKNNIQYKYERKNCIVEEEPQDNFNETPNNDNLNSISVSIRNALNNNNQNPNFQNGQNFDDSRNFENINNFRQRPKLSNSNQTSSKDIEEDAQSNFSFVSSHYERIKNYLNNKDNLDFLLNILQFIIVGIILFFIFKYGLRFSRAVRLTVTEKAKVLADPKKLLINIIWGIIKGILVGIMWNYLYLSLPLAVISFIAYKIKEKIDFKNLCKKIIEDIKDDLRIGPSDKNGRRTISEKDIKAKYSKKYNIDYNTFVKKYLQELKKMRSDDHSLKEYPVQGEIFWELV